MLDTDYKKKKKRIHEPNKRSEENTQTNHTKQ